MNLRSLNGSNSSIGEPTRKTTRSRNAFNRFMWRVVLLARRSTMRYALLAGACFALSAAAWANPNPPEFSPAAGNCSSPCVVTISDPKSSGATIYYTTDGTTPTDTSPEYTSPITLPTGTTDLQAIAYNSGRYSTVTSGTYDVSVSNPVITVDASSGVVINPHDYGANNMWYYVPGADFYTSGGGTGSYVSSLVSNAGVTYLRFPGGYESEWYEWYTGNPIFSGGPDWTANTLDSAYKNYTATPGATPAQVTSAMGAGNESFVVRTEDALEAGTTAAYEEWAGVAGSLVGQYCTSSGGGVKDWQIGNEWYNDSGAHSNYTEYLDRYADIVFYYAQSMEAAAATAGCSINIYVTSNWASLVSTDGDMSALEAAVEALSATSTAPWTNSGTTVWTNDVSGADIHVYTGVAPDQSKFFPPPAISSIPTIIANIKADSGKSLVYVSEWAADLKDNDSYGGLQDANTMMQILGQMAQAGITQAAYWPPVMPDSDPQADTITLLHNTTNTTDTTSPYDCTTSTPCATPPYTVDADAQAMQMLSTNYLGTSLATSSTSAYTQAIAALNSSNQIVVFLMTNGAPLTEIDQINVSGGPSWSKVDSAQVLYADSSQVISSGPATVASVSPSVFTVNGQSVTVPLDLGGSGVDGTWEIIELVLGN